MGKFIIKTTSTGFTFSLKAVNGQIIATGGEIYNTISSVKGGIASVAKNAPEAAVEDQTVSAYETKTNPKFEIYKDKAGEFRFRLKARNGEVIAVSEGYVKKDSCKNGIESVRRNSVDAPVIEPIK
ncbi:MAG: YegP family protein [Ruminococcus flavefaciens]|nr:MAG: hypothetical protein BWZ04_02574 [Firmicutes bacterium ADurb.BinA205]HOC34687.1 YegP family protein [Ruminococcus flavefaciens]HQM02860.1 YegP family protein [Ruminococcus flavefaciens]